MINNNRCERCFKKTNTFSMSIFEPKMICMECIEKEKDHPDYELAKKAEIEMPITEGIYRIIKGEISAKEAAEELMGRDRRHEKE